MTTTTTTTTPPFDPFIPPPSARHAANAEGEAFIWQAYPGIVLEKATGVLSLELARIFGEFYVPILVPGANLKIFVDLEGLATYTRETREFLDSFAAEHRDGIEAIHFLLASKALSLGISSFKHSVGDPLVHTYFDRASFLLSYQATVRETLA